VLEIEPFAEDAGSRPVYTDLDVPPLLITGAGGWIVAHRVFLMELSQQRRGETG
jgi:hypothetical protein